jgi:hypothetical protein
LVVVSAERCAGLRTSTLLDPSPTAPDSSTPVVAAPTRSILAYAVRPLLSAPTGGMLDGMSRSKRIALVVVALLVYTAGWGWWVVEHGPNEGPIYDFPTGQ